MIISNSECYHLNQELLIIVIKVIMILSHGNNIERSFSVNKEKACLWDNMKDEIVAARRIIYDAMVVWASVDLKMFPNFCFWNFYISV